MGNGMWGICLMHKLIECRIPIKGFIDNDLTQCGKNILSYEIIHPHSFDDNKKTIIIAAKKKSEEIKAQLQDYGYQDNIDFITLQG